MRPVLLCLHGWGGTKNSWKELTEALDDDDFTILAPNLPGFGDEPDPPRPWSTDDYAAWVERWLAQRGIAEPIAIVGHSHGGRIAMKMAVRGHVPIRHLFLCAAAGIRRQRHIKRIVGLLLAKAGKGLLNIPGLSVLQPSARRLLYKLVRVHDYERASPVLQQTLILVTREDFRPVLERIRVPTDIFWGEDDQMTPIADGRLMHEKIAGSHLHAFAGVRHRVHRDRAQELATVIRERL